MHIPNALLSAPVAATTGVIAAGALAYSLRRLRGELGERTTVLMGVMSAFVFAAQMVNFPLLGLPASGHLIGAVLVAVLLGPWAAIVALSAVLLVQSLLFADGGLLALGANITNLAVVTSLGGFVVYDPLRRLIGGRRGILIAAMVAAWLSVILASIAFSIELAASARGFDFLRVLTWMTLIHAAIGMGEALITGLVLRTILQVRPDLLESADAPPSSRWRLALAGVAVSLSVAAFLAPFASSYSDGLEYVGGLMGFLPEGAAPAPLPSPMPDYEFPGLASPAMATAVAGIVGTLVVFTTAWVLSRSIVPAASVLGRKPELEPDAH